MQVSQPLKLATSLSKSDVYFRHARWQGKRCCPRCRQKKLYRLSSGQFKCTRCTFKFGDFTGTYLGTVRVALNVVAHLLYLFVLGVPVYRSRRYIGMSLKTAHRTFTVFREAIYSATMMELGDLALTGAIEMDEALFSGKRHGKRGWGAAGKQMVFGMYMRRGKVLTFPISSRGRDDLLPLIEAHTKPGSLYLHR